MKYKIPVTLGDEVFHDHRQLRHPDLVPSPSILVSKETYNSVKKGL
jgi:hypothetical protein